MFHCTILYELLAGIIDLGSFIHVFVCIFLQGYSPGAFTVLFCMHFYTGILTWGVLLHHFEMMLYMHRRARTIEQHFPSATELHCLPLCAILFILNTGLCSCRFYYTILYVFTLVLVTQGFTDFRGFTVHF